jgi:hypothetical protein
MISAVKCDETRTPGAFLRELQRGLDRLRTTVGEVNARQIARQHLAQSRGQLDLRLDDVFAINHHVQMTARLIINRAQDRGMAVAESGNPDSGDEIQVAAAIDAVQP